MNYSDSFKSMQIPPNTYEVNTIHRDDQNIVSGNIEKRLIEIEANKSKEDNINTE